LSGRLDAVGKQAEDEFLAGRASPLRTIFPCKNFGFNIVASLDEIRALADKGFELLLNL
jgi:hypothetical protein